MARQTLTMTGLNLSEKHWQIALERVSNMPIYAGSHRGEQANQVGFLGEVVIEEWFQTKGVNYFDNRGSTEFDYLVEGVHRVEIKTKDRTVKP